MNRMCHFIWWYGENHPNTLVFMPFKEWNTLEVDFVRFSPLTKRCSEKCLKVVEQTQAFNATKRLHQYQDVSYYTRMGKYSS